MDKKGLQPIEVLVNDGRERAKPFPFKMQSTDIGELLSEVVQLAKLIATQERDVEAIRKDFALRIKQQDHGQERAMALLHSEYAERDAQMRVINENVKLFISLGQYDIAKAIVMRLTDILADSPLKNAMHLKSSG